LELSSDQLHSLLSLKTKTKTQYRGVIYPDVDFNVNLDHIRHHNKTKTQKKLQKISEKPDEASEEDHSMSITRTNIAKEDELTSTARLAHIISKEDFKKMDVLGQFNLGFIIARLRTAETQELFIVDQHARYYIIKKNNNIFYLNNI